MSKGRTWMNTTLSFTPTAGPMVNEFNSQRARAKRPCPLWVDAFQRDTQHLEADEVGAYFLIIMAMWTRETCDFPDDDNRLARVCRVSPRLWKSRIGGILRPFFSAENGALVSKRLRQEASYVERHCKAQSNRKTGENDDNQLNYNDVGPTTDATTDMTADDPRHHPTQLPNYPSKKEEEAIASLSSDDDEMPMAEKPDDASEALRLFNAAASDCGWPQVRVLNKIRRVALLARLRDAGGLSGWAVALAKARASPHCNGQNDRGWVASFDFITRQSSFAKLMEGNYDPRPASPPRSAFPGVPGGNRHPVTIASIVAGRVAQGEV